MGEKLIANNKRAYHDYYIDDTWEAGLVLTGTEVKSLRDGKASLQEAFCRIKDGEVFINNMTIPEYEQGNRENHDPTRVRKLLLHHEEIAKLIKGTEIKGLSLVPTRLYFKGGRAKIEIALGRGKKHYDKRETLKSQQAKREVARELKHYNR
jgi:SsrA-binding protein